MKMFKATELEYSKPFEPIAPFFRTQYPPFPGGKIKALLFFAFFYLSDYSGLLLFTIFLKIKG